MSPGKWEPFFGGHMHPEESELESAAKELAEELGIFIHKTDLLPFGVKKDEDNHEFQTVYTLLWHGHINKLVLEKDEVEIVRFFPVKEVKEIFEKRDPEWTHIAYGREVLDWLLS
jgi:8-oxo-dGTP pyrophosphatase MutT (NUDIX family)